MTFFQNPLSETLLMSDHRVSSYRFRLVSLSCDPNFTFSIDGHGMTIIEVDSISHSPLAVDQIQIFAGTPPPR